MTTVIVGAGPAGLAAAITAAEAGVETTLLDKQPVLGGQLWISGGQMSGAVTRRQRAKGIVDTPDDHYADVMRITHGKANPAITRLAVEAQGEMVDWLDGLGLDIDPNAPFLVYGHEAYGIARTYHGRMRGRSVLALFEQQVARHRDRIDFRPNSRVTRLLCDGDTVTGVEVTPVEGDPYTIHTDLVVLATGGFAANRDLIQRFQPAEKHDYLIGCLDHATGDGLLMAEAIGAATTSYVGTLPTFGLIIDPHRPGYAVHWPDAYLSLTAQARTIHEILVNKEGERFFREDHPSAEAHETALAAQTDEFMAAVWDDRILRAVDRPIIGAFFSTWTPDAIAAAPFIRRANTIADLAGLLGVDAANLERTVADYNAAVASGTDRFGRTTLPLPIDTPPYYGVASRSGNLLSREGLRVTTDMQPVRADSTPIHGLVAIGEVIGAATTMGDSFASGMSVGPALALGRRIGQRIAAREGMAV